MSFDLIKLVVLIFCIGSVLFDLRFRRVPNYFILLGLGITFSVCIFNSMSWIFVGTHLTSVLVTLITGFILWRFGALGAGDVKVLAVAAISFEWKSSLEFFFYSLAWGALLGMTALILEKGLVTVVNKFNFNSIMTIRTLGIGDHKIPFTVAVLFGLLSAWLLESKGVHFL